MMPCCLKWNCLCKALIDGSESLLTLLCLASQHSSKLENFKTLPLKFRNSTQNVVQIFAYNFENIETIAVSKFRRYFISLKKSLISSKFTLITFAQYCTNSICCMDDIHKRQNQIICRDHLPVHAEIRESPC